MVDLQMSFCSERGVECVPTRDGDRLGYAVSTVGLLPVNGLRHQAEHGTSGWYLWCGEELSQAADFFEPQCASHACDRHPEVRKLLGLPPGYRFLLSPSYLDFWFDASLLQPGE